MFFKVYKVSEALVFIKSVFLHIFGYIGIFISKNTVSVRFSSQSMSAMTAITVLNLIELKLLDWTHKCFAQLTKGKKYIINKISKIIDISSSIILKFQAYIYTIHLYNRSLKQIRCMAIIQIFYFYRNNIITCIANYVNYIA